MFGHIQDILRSPLCHIPYNHLAVKSISQVQLIEVVIVTHRIICETHALCFAEIVLSQLKTFLSLLLFTCDLPLMTLHHMTDRSAGIVYRLLIDAEGTCHAADVTFRRIQLVVFSVPGLVKN